VPGGRLVCVVGDVCLSRRKNKGRHTVVPLHATIQDHCRMIGFDNLAPIIWNKITSASHEADHGDSGFLGKPYEPGAIIKHEIEFILLLRKPGGYRSPSPIERLMSLIPENKQKSWFKQIWQDLKGEPALHHHPAPYPIELAERLVRMFSFVGDVVVDPFVGSGTTVEAAYRWRRNSIGVDINEAYVEAAKLRLEKVKDTTEDRGFWGDNLPSDDFT
jgi:DNA modification methylase